MGEQAEWDSMQEDPPDPPPFDRAQGIGGSDMAAILGISPFRSEWDVWLEKTRDPAWKPQDESPEMRLGKLLEPVVLEMYREETGYATVLHVSDGEPSWHPNGILFAHPDASAWIEPDDGRMIVEIKVVRDSREWGSGPPLYYETQGRVYQAIWPDYSSLEYAVLFRSDATFRRYPLERDQTIEDRLVRAADEWWERRVVRQEPPTMDGSTGASAYLAHRSPGPTTQDLMLYGPDFESLILTHIALQQNIARNETNLAIIKNKIRDAMSEFPRAEGIGWHVIFNRTKGGSTVAWKEVAKAYRRLITEAREEPRRIAALNQLAAIDLDAIESIYTTHNESARPLIVKDDTK